MDDELSHAHHSAAREGDRTIHRRRNRCARRGRDAPLKVRLTRPLTSYEQEVVDELEDSDLDDVDSDVLLIRVALPLVLNRPQMLNQYLDQIQSLGATAQQDALQRLQELNGLVDLINQKLS